MHLHARAFDFIVERFLHHASARGYLHRAAPEHREFQLAAFVQVARRPIDNDAADLFDLCGERKKPAPGRDVGAPAMVYHDDVRCRRSRDRGRAQMLLRLLQPGWLDLHRYRASDDPRAGP
jgi:hypothetical protein